MAKLLSVFAMLVVSEPIYALEFSTDSRLASGKWVKIGIPKTGVYEISYYQLRRLGFESPEKVSIYGTGGEEIPLNFINVQGDVFVKDDLQPVPVSRRDSKLLFYAQGPDNIRWYADSKDVYAGGYFENLGLNFYSDYGYYFLSDSQSDKSPEIESMEKTESELPVVSNGWGYVYHETDNTLGPNYSGKELWGERFVTSDEKAREFTCKFPGLYLTGNLRGTVMCRFMSNCADYSELEFSGNSIKGTQRFAIPALVNEATFSVNSGIKKSAIGFKAGDGKIFLKYQPASTIKHAYLDYFLVTYPRTFAFENENQFRVFVNGGQKFATASNIETWDVSDINNPRILYSDNEYCYLPDGGLEIVRFNRDANTLLPSSYENIANANLHRLATDNEPTMIIITTEEIYPAACELADYHKQKGDDVMVVKVTDIYNEFSSGRPDPQAYRLLAKMMYDKNPSNPLECILLLGQIRGDVKKSDPANTIIALQSESGARSTETHSLIDVYGMTDSYYSGNIQTRPMRLAVAVLPVNNTDETSRYLKKVKAFESDESLPYWMDNRLFIGDDYNEGMHYASVEELINKLNNAADNKGISYKNYLGEAPTGILLDNFLKYLKKGMGYTLYMGHGGNTNIGSNTFWNLSSLNRLNNKRCGFMTFGGCSTTLYETLNRGISESMVLGRDYGLVGTLATIREVWATENHNFINRFNEALYSKLDKTTGIPPHLGEALLVAKSNERTANKFNFNLICDPLLRLPLPTLGASINNFPPTVNPGDDVMLQGTINTPGGALAGDFNGKVVVKWFGPAFSCIPRNLISGYKTTTEIEYDQDLVATQEISVANGKFEQNIRCPEYLAKYHGKEMSCTITAFDPDSRLIAFGKANFNLGGNGNVNTSDNRGPAIESISISAEDPMKAPTSTDLLISISDETGIRTNADAPELPLNVSLDGTVIPDIVSFLSMQNAGKRLELNIPLQGLEEGIHEVKVYSTDYVGNSSSSAYTFRVAPETVAPLVLKGECRDSAELEYPEEALTSDSDMILIILTHEGHHVAKRNVRPGDAWDLTDDEGRRVAPGLYKAILRFGGKASLPANIPVLSATR